LSKNGYTGAVTGTIANIAEGRGSCGVGANKIALHHVVAGISDVDADFVPRNDIALDRVGVAVKLDQDAIAVAHAADGRVARDVGADVIVQDEVARSAKRDADAGSAVVRGDIAGAGGSSPDDVACGRSDHYDAETGVAQGAGPGGVRADEVTFNHI